MALPQPVLVKDGAALLADEPPLLLRRGGSSLGFGRLRGQRMSRHVGKDTALVVKVPQGNQLQLDACGAYLSAFETTTNPTW